ncbi:MAG: glycine--tRNA ligase subunit beta, partial [Myxococcales bacterium]|nr:glycine--tRNA ligase subunit beta [Myxococcales bacterium]
NARGAISVAERANYIQRIRGLAVRCCEVWHEEVARHHAPAPAPAPANPSTPSGDPTGTGQLLVEVQCEELPARMVDTALGGLRAGVLGLLNGIEHGAVRTYATPRRLAVVVDGVAEARPAVTRLVTGPPADRAMAADGTPLPAGIGFAKGKGLDPSALRVIDGPKGKVVAVEVTEGGERTADLLSAGLDQVVRGLPFPKTMEWAHGGVRWARPIHRVNAVLGGVSLGGLAAGVPIGAETVGHRLAGEAFAFRDEAGWLEGLRARHVEPDHVLRRERVLALLREATERIGCDPIADDELVAEVTHLVEAPTLVIGRFDESLLELPPRLLVQTMKQNQRYFPTFKGGELHSEFVIVSNNPTGDHDLVADGNAAVILARFDDARFFLAEDRKQRLEQHGERLVQMRWIRGLGTMADRQARIGLLATALAERVGADAAVVHRAGQLCKSDLVTQMVYEFPELQGHVGRLYAAAQGEDAAVALAIEESWLPAFADDAVPTTPAGVALALADRLDALVGCFGVGLAPKSGGDPQGLRRAALALVRILVERGIRADLPELFGLAIEHFHPTARGAGFEAWEKARGHGPECRDADALVAELTAFVLARFAAAQQTTADVVDAVLAVSPPDPLLLTRKVEALAALAGRPEFGAILVTFKRVLNITKGKSFPAPLEAELTHEAERDLARATRGTANEIHDAVERLDFGRACELALALQAPVAALFDAVLVESPDERERAVRLGLLLEVADSFLKVADFSRISTR